MESDYKSGIYAVVAACIALPIIYFVTVLRNYYRFFETRGIKGPKPTLVFGHLHLTMTKNLGEITREWAAEHGRVSGFFFGVNPRLLIADAETLNQVCIKDFDAFTDHAGMGHMDKYQEKFLFFLKGDRWRRIRAFMSPTFTSAKIRRMYKMVDVCADDLTSLFREQLEDGNNGISATVNLHDLFGLYTMDAIATCCYGMKMERVKGSNNLDAIADRNEFVRLCIPIFRISKLRTIIRSIIPGPLLRLLGFTSLGQDNIGRLAGVVSKLLEARRNASQTKKFNDYLQLLIESRLDDTMDLDHVDQAENHHAALSHETLKADQQRLIDSVIHNHHHNSTTTPDDNNRNNVTLKPRDITLTDMEILSNAMFLLVVGLETTASLLTSCMYALSHHPKIQQRLYEEIKALSEDGDKTFDYEKLTTNKYLDAVISESLRIEPVVAMVDRKANRDYHFDKWNFSIPKGSVIFVGIHAVQHDPEYWPAPDEFNPDRFMPENRDKIVPGSYCPFGIGPRHCVGMRFSLTETKLAIAKLMMQFSFEPVPGLGYPAKLSAKLGTLLHEDPRVILKPR